MVAKGVSADVAFFLVANVVAGFAVFYFVNQSGEAVAQGVDFTRVFS
jgi:hypothetical protein